MMDDTRMTWAEIQNEYPDQWVGLTEVKYRNDDGISVESGIVKYVGRPKGEEITKRLNEKNIPRLYWRWNGREKRKTGQSDISSIDSSLMKMYHYAIKCVGSCVYG